MDGCSTSREPVGMSADISATISANESLKKLKGSKLDAKRRAEYQSELARAESWDTSSWPRWTVTGRVLPERCDVNVAPRFSHGVGASGRFQLRLQVVRSHIAVKCVAEKDASVLEIADVARSALAFPVDYIAFQNRGAYEIILDLCINDRTGEVFPIPINEPTFETREANLCFDSQADKSNLIIPFGAAATPELATALHDL